MDYAAKQERQEKEDVVEFRLGDVLFLYELRKVVAAMARVGEVAYITKSTAQELASALNDGMKQLRQILNQARSALSAAGTEIDRVRGDLVLHSVPGILTKLGLKDSEDRRKAVWTTHPDYLAAVEFERYMRWVVNDLDSKHRHLYDANQTALAVAGGRQDFHRGGVSGGSPQTQAGPAPKYGSPRFD